MAIRVTTRDVLGPSLPPCLLPDQSEGGAQISTSAIQQGEHNPLDRTSGAWWEGGGRRGRGGTWEEERVAVYAPASDWSGGRSRGSEEPCTFLIVSLMAIRHFLADHHWQRVPRFTFGNSPEPSCCLLRWWMRTEWLRLGASRLLYSGEKPQRNSMSAFSR